MYDKTVAEIPAKSLPVAARPAQKFKIFPARKLRAAKVLHQLLGKAPPEQVRAPDPVLPALDDSSDQFDMSSIPWVIPGRTFSKLHFLWFVDGPPVCQRKQASAKVFRTALLSGSGLPEALLTGQEICRNCRSKLKLPQESE